MGGRFYKYGISLDEDLNEWELETYCFREGWPTEMGGLGRFRHFKNAVNQMWPKTIWNKWMERQIESLCDDAAARYRGDQRFLNVSWTGCATSGKTYASALFAMQWWLASPTTSAVVLTSTSKGMVARRVWPVVQELFHTAELDGVKQVCGHLIDSRKIIQAQKGDDLHSISAIAVGEGETQKAVKHLQGIHPERYLIIIDEAAGTPEAIYGVIPNARKSCQEIIVLSIANAESKLDCHGRVSEPLNGWQSISVADLEWETAGVKEWQMEPGVCLHFPGWDSPNVKAKKTLFPFLYTWEDHLAAEERGTETLAYWIYDAGFWPPDGLSNTVLNMEVIAKEDMRGAFLFRGGRTRIAGLDPAFGGDQACFVVGEMGMLMDGRQAVQVVGRLPIYLKSEKASPEPIDHQIARQVIRHCQEQEVEPSHFGMDSTGIGRGVDAILKNDWSRDFISVGFGNSPSDRPASDADPRPSSEVYDRKATELLFQVREAGYAGLLKGLSADVCKELCGRIYFHKNKKIWLEKKEDYKKRLHHSPDESDAVAVLVEVARHHGLEMRRGAGTATANVSWEKAAREAHDVFDDTPEEKALQTAGDVRYTFDGMEY